MDNAGVAEQRAGADTPRMRRRILRILLGSPAPRDAAGIAAETGLHVSTVRFHLEQLEASDLARREAEHRGARGRPRMLYTAGPAARAAETQRALMETLAGALARDGDDGAERARAAGREWAATLPAETLDEGEQGVFEALERLGFDPEPEGAGSIALHACPLRPLADEHQQVVCAVHLGLLQGTMEKVGKRRSDVELRPFVAPGLCRVLLEDTGGTEGSGAHAD